MFMTWLKRTAQAKRQWNAYPLKGNDAFKKKDREMYTVPKQNHRVVLGNIQLKHFIIYVEKIILLHASSSKASWYERKYMNLTFLAYFSQ